MTPHSFILFPKTHFAPIMFWWVGLETNFCTSFLLNWWSSSCMSWTQSISSSGYSTPLGSACERKQANIAFLVEDLVWTPYFISLITYSCGWSLNHLKSYLKKYRYGTPIWSSFNIRSKWLTLRLNFHRLWHSSINCKLNLNLNFFVDFIYPRSKWIQQSNSNSTNRLFGYFILSI